MIGAGRIRWVVGSLLAFALVGLLGVVGWSSRTSTDVEIPVTRAELADLTPKIYSTGELKASRSARVSSPQIGGGSLQITHLLRTGARVKKGDVVVEFDPSEQQFKLEQNRSELEQADQEIIKAKADTAVQAATDVTALLKARFDVRRAELEVGKNELVSTIDARKNELALEQAKRALAQTEQDVKSHSASGQAGIGVAEEKRHKAKLAMDQAQSNIEKMKVLASMDGIVSIEKNTSGDFFFGGMALPDYHEGDQANPGETIASIIDGSEIEVSAKLREQDRNNVKAGELVEITADAVPGQTFSGTVKTVGAMTARNFWDNDQGGHFEIVVQVPRSDSRLRPGFTVQITIAGELQKSVLCIPRQAMFLSDTKRIVYVKNGTKFEAKEVKVIAETESRAAIEGIGAGTDVALVNPEASTNSSSSSSGPTAAEGPR